MMDNIIITEYNHRTTSAFVSGLKTFTETVIIDLSPVGWILIWKMKKKDIQSILNDSTVSYANFFQLKQVLETNPVKHKIDIFKNCSKFLENFFGKK